jgi:4-hydroxy-3-methylbut-2-enyl diphosphate reductase
MKIVLANPRGFCAGVDRAIAIVNRAIELFGAPIYVRHEVVHNKHVVDELKSRGAIFVKEVDQVPDGGTIIFSAHGVSKAVQENAAGRDLQVFDATCPLVTKVHFEVARYARRGEEVVLIGHAGHPEVVGTMGQYIKPKGIANGTIYLVESLEDVAALTPKNPALLSYVSQTTLSVEETKEIISALKDKFPEIKGPKNEDICYATTNRQDAVRTMARDCDLILVVGSKNSSNSNRLRELAEQRGCKAYLIDDASDVQNEWLQGVTNIGVTAGASAPELLVQDVIAYLQKHGGVLGEEYQGAEETIIFAMPKVLRKGKAVI